MMQKYRCGGATVWRCGGVAVWRCGGVAVRRCGGAAVWRCGGGMDRQAPLAFAAPVFKKYI